MRMVAHTHTLSMRYHHHSTHTKCNIIIFKVPEKDQGVWGRAQLKGLPSVHEGVLGWVPSAA